MTNVPGGPLTSYARPLAVRNPTVKEALENNRFWQLHASIELTGTCNLRCQVCSQGALNAYRGTPRAAAIWPLEGVKQIIDQLAELGIKYLSFNVFNEPFMYPHLREVIEYAIGKNIQPAMSTNIAKLEPWIYDYPVTIVATFYQGGSKQANAPGYTKAVLDRLPRLLEWVETASTNHPFMDNKVQTIYGIYTPDEWDEPLSFIIPQPWAGQYLDDALAHLKDYPDEVLSEWGWWLCAPDVYRAKECSWAGLMEIVILSTGEMQLCCVDSQAEMVWGQLDKTNPDLKQALFTKGFDAWRKLQKYTPAVCERCLQANMIWEREVYDYIDAIEKED